MVNTFLWFLRLCSSKKLSSTSILACSFIIVSPGTLIFETFISVLCYILTVLNLFQIWCLDLLLCRFTTHLFSQFLTMVALFMIFPPNLVHYFCKLLRQLQQKITGCMETTANDAVLKDIFLLSSVLDLSSQKCKKIYHHICFVTV